MVDSSVTKKLIRAFPGSFINGSLEFIAHKTANEWFRLEDCETEFDVKCKVLEWLSRGAYKGQPFDEWTKNACFQYFMRTGINNFLGTDFSEDDMESIYTRLGGSCNHLKTMNFIECGYDMRVLEGR